MESSKLCRVNQDAYNSFKFRDPCSSTVPNILNIFTYIWQSSSPCSAEPHPRPEKQPVPAPCYHSPSRAEWQHLQSESIKRKSRFPVWPLHFWIFRTLNNIYRHYGHEDLPLRIRAGTASFPSEQNFLLIYCVLTLFFSVSDILSSIMEILGVFWGVHTGWLMGS